MKTVIVIPSRYAAVRLPGKPLLRETGKYLVQHVYEVAIRAKCADLVVVATDDRRIMDAVESFGGKAVMTRSDHQSGTDRMAEVATGICADADILVNLQGDEPLFDPAGLDQTVELLHRDPEASVATLATPLRDPRQYTDPTCVKVVIDNRGRALYFSRSPIPVVRDGEPDFTADPPRFLMHLGVYAYCRQALLKTSALPPHPLEQAEKLEQLRVLGNGGIITVGLVPTGHRGVDTPADYAAFVEKWKAANEGKRT